MKRLAVIATIGALAAASWPAQAHHSGAMFDRSKQVTLDGTVREFNWSNPHASFAVEVMKPGDETVIWDVEMNSPNNLVREGWTRTILKPGDKVSVVINPLRDGKPGGVYVSITLQDGKTLGVGAPPR